MWKWIKDIFNPMSGSEREEPDGLKADNGIEHTEEIIEQIVATLRRADNVQNLFGLKLWVNDDVLSTILMTKGFVLRLKQAFDNANMEQFGAAAVEVSVAPPAFGATTVIKDQLFVSILQEEQQSTGNLIVEISCVEDTGSLAKKYYILDTSKKSVFYIGRGTVCNKNGIYRTNDIVIKNNETEPNLALNNSFVSGSQANIVMRGNKVFLQAMRPGCRTEGGSSTVIIHNQTPTELRDTRTLYPLQNGDMIELGKKVLLKVKIYVKNNSEDS